MGNSRRLFRLIAALAVAAAVSLSPAAMAQEAAFVGIQIQGLSPEVTAALGLDKQQGVLVRDVAQGGPSGKAGFQRGDLILKMAGTGVESFEHVLKIVGGLKAGQKVPVTVLRGGKPLDLVLETGRWPEQWRIAKDSFAVIPEVGLTLAAVTDKVRETFELKWGSVGVLVTLVDAEKAGDMDLRRGELIVQINQEDVWLPDHVIAKYREAKTRGRQKLLALVDGVGGFRFSLVPVR